LNYLSEMKTLRKLYFNYSDEFWKILKTLRNLINIRYLFIEWKSNNIDEIIQMIDSLKVMTYLKELDFFFPLNDVALKELSSLKNIRILRQRIHTDFHDDDIIFQITEEGIYHLLQLTKLKILYLSQYNLYMNILHIEQLLSKSQSLESLYIIISTKYYDMDTFSLVYQKMKEKYQLTYELKENHGLVIRKNLILLNPYDKK